MSMLTRVFTGRYVHVVVLLLGYSSVENLVL